MLSHLGLAALVALVGLAGCGEETPDDTTPAARAGKGGAAGKGGSGQGCLPGQQVECPCPGTASKGVQVCKSDGKGLSACSGCPGGDGGQGGAGASQAGQGGSPGGAGQGGAGQGGAGSAGSGQGGIAGASGGQGGQGEAGASPAGQGGEAGQGGGVDGAEIEAHSFPSQLSCGQSISVTLSMKNSGTSTWTKAGGYRLVAAAPGPLSADSSAELGDADAVAPGQSHLFSLNLAGLPAAGGATTGWRMERGGQGFGASFEQAINTGCGAQPSFDLASVIIQGSPDVRGFAVTSELNSLSFAPGTFHIDHTKRGTWPPVQIDPDGTTQEATVWVFFSIGDAWYGTGGERLRPDQTDKELSQPSQIGPGWLYDPNRWGPMTNYVPKVGDLVGFMVVAGSTRSDNNVIVQERTQVVLVPFPPDGQASSFPPFAAQF